jgi:hypothetical protein
LRVRCREHLDIGALTLPYLWLSAGGAVNKRRNSVTPSG